MQSLNTNPAGRTWLRILGCLAVVLLAACSTTPPTPIIITQAVLATDAPTPTATIVPTSTPLPAFTPAPSPVPGGLFVDASQDLGPIDPLVYGTNYGPWIFVSLDMEAAAKDAKLTIVRYPGGNWGDLNDLEQYQIDQFMGFLKQNMNGAQPFINVRLKGGTAQQAAALVKYANITKNYGITYWGIGNEPNLYGNGYTVDQYNKDWREWALAMKAVDPTIKLIGPEVSQFQANPAGSYMQNIEFWLTQFLVANGDLVDVVAIHRYPFPADGSTPPTKAQMRDNSKEWDATIPYLRELVRKHTGRDLPVGVTEVNSSWAKNSAGEATMDSHYNAIWWGDSLGRMIRQGVSIVNQFAIIGEYGLMDQHAVYPTYYVYKMYQLFGTQRIYASSDNPNVSLFAAQRADGTLTLLAVNLSSQAESPKLMLANVNPTQPVETWLFDQTHNVEKVDPTTLGPETTLNLSPESMTLFVIPQP